MEKEWGKQKAPVRALQQPPWLQGPQALRRLASERWRRDRAFENLGEPHPPPTVYYSLREKLQASVEKWRTPRTKASFSGNRHARIMHPGRRHQKGTQLCGLLSPNPSPPSIQHEETASLNWGTLYETPDQRFPTWSRSQETGRGWGPEAVPDPRRGPASEWAC